MVEKIREEQTLMPKRKTEIGIRFDPKTRTPRVRLKINAPEHARGQVISKEVLLGSEENCTKVWRVDNRSDWPAFLTLVEDVDPVEEERV